MKPIVKGSFNCCLNVKHFFAPVLVLVLLCCFGQAKAQNFFPEQTDYGFRFGADIDLPGKSLSDDYRAGINYNLSFMKYYEKWTFDATVGYRQFKAKYPSITEFDNTTGLTSTTTTSPFESLQLSIGAVYNFSLSNTSRFYVGLNSGVYFTSYSMSYQDDNTSLFYGSSEKQAYVAPKLGVAFQLNNNLDVDLHAAYNIFTEHYEVNSRTGTSGTLFTSASAGLGLVYKF